MVRCRTLSIVSAGKAYLDVRQALSDLGLDDRYLSADWVSDCTNRA